MVIHHITFQFHKGTIRTVGDKSIEAWHSNFNSIKVRLERRFAPYYEKCMLFQFHKGTIRTLQYVRYKGENEISIP